jgi:hypothetical protein
MEVVVKYARSYHRRSIGCQRHERDVMIALSNERSTEFEVHDFFLTQEQAILLIEDLKRVISINDSLDNEHY